MARILLLITSCALLLSACGEKEEKLGPATFDDILGTYSGELTQKGLDPFTVQATIRSLQDEPSGSVRYSGLDCRGTWTFIGTDNETFRFREVIDAGRSKKCKGRGEVRLTPDGDKYRYVFTGGGVESRGTLSRR